MLAVGALYLWGKTGNFQMLNGQRNESSFCAQQLHDFTALTQPGSPAEWPDFIHLRVCRVMRECSVLPWLAGRHLIRYENTVR